MWEHLRRSPRIPLVGALLALITGAAARALLEGTSRQMIFGGGIVVAISLFCFRFRFRLIYGLGELVFGLLVLWDATGKGRGAFSSDFSSDFDIFQLSVVVIQIFGAIYVLIRGMDNCYQGLPEARRKAIDEKIKQWHL